MKTQKELNNDKGITCILDLPEEIFRKIFQHISSQELFFTIIKVNRDVQQYVEDYLSLQGVFVLIREQNMPTLLIHIFKREGNKYETHSLIAPSFPILDHSSNINVENAKLDLFPLLTISTGIQGPLLFGVHSRIRIVSRIGVPFYNNSIAGRVAVDLYGFDVDKCSWKHLKTRYANIKNRIIMFSALSDSTLLIFQSTRKEGIGYSLELISICLDTDPHSSLKDSTGHGQRRINIPEEVQRLRDFSLLTLTNNSIVLIGGRYVYYPAPYGSPAVDVLNRVIWQGTLTNGNTKIEWDAINIGRSRMGYNPICFKLRDNVYITGDHKNCSSDTLLRTFHRYNYKEKKMYLNAYSMPDGLSNMYHPVQIAKDENETFAVLVFKNIPPHISRRYGNMKMSIFTEEGGFVQVYDNEQSDKELENAFNWFFECSALVYVGNLSNNCSLISGGN